MFADVDDEMRIAQSEIFGPVMSVLRWSNEDDVIERSNSLPFGLTANIVTNDLSAALRLARRLESGYVWVNGRGQRPMGAPFGGFGYSGLGEENSLGEVMSYTRAKNLNIGEVGTSWAPPTRPGSARPHRPSRMSFHSCLPANP